jgi:hypothetical protein
MRSKNVGEIDHWTPIRVKKLLSAKKMSFYDVTQKQKTYLLFRNWNEWGKLWTPNFVV